MEAPLFEVTTPTANLAARRLTTAAKVQAVLFGGAATDTVLIESMIDRVSAAFARHCNLARDPGGLVPTFGRETCRATWRLTRTARSCILMMPWRLPISSISSVVEDGVTLDAASYKLREGAMLERLDEDGASVSWSSAAIVVTYVAGWDLTTPDTVWPDVEAAVIEQVKAMHGGKDRDPTVRAEATDSVGSATYSGDSSVALLPAVEAAIEGLRLRPV